MLNAQVKTKNSLRSASKRCLNNSNFLWNFVWPSLQKTATNWWNFETGDKTNLNILWNIQFYSSAVIYLPSSRTEKFMGGWLGRLLRQMHPTSRVARHVHVVMWLCSWLPDNECTWLRSAANTHRQNLQAPLSTPDPCHIFIHRLRVLTALPCLSFITKACAVFDLNMKS